MALLAQGFDPSGYTPSYAIANAANQDLFNRQVAAQQEVQGAITDYEKEQKALAQKDKEMAAKIKGTLSLLDNAKALYPDFAQQIDSTKLQLSDPSLSNLDKIGIAGQVENSLNMMVTQGSEATKTALRIAELQQSERSLMPTAQARKTKFYPVFDNATKTNRDAIIDEQTGEVLGFVGEGLIDTPPAKQMPSSQMPLPTGGGGLNSLPRMAPTIEGPEIPLDESQVVKQLPNGDELRVYQGTQYTVPSPSVLPPKSEPNAIAAGIDSSLTTAPSPTAVPAPSGSAIASAAQITQPRFTQPQEDPAKKAERERRARLEESQISANIAAAEKQKSETIAKEEKQILTEKQKLAAAQDARATIRDAITDVKKYASQIGETYASDVIKKGSQYFSTSNQARLNQAIKPISAKMIWDQMSKLREASATGSTGLGSLTEGERKNLEATVTSLDAMQAPSDIIKGMGKIEDYMRNAEFGNREERKKLVAEGKMTPIRYNEIEKGYSKPEIISELGSPTSTLEQNAILNKYLPK